MVEFKVMGLYKHEEEGVEAQHFVLLRDESGSRVPIWVGVFEASQISYALDKTPANRPLTLELMTTVISSFDGTLAMVELTLRDNTFFATIFLEGNGKVRPIDARASDAIALALYAGAPIVCDDTVLAVIEEKQWPPAPKSSAQVKRRSVINAITKRLRS